VVSHQLAVFRKQGIFSHGLPLIELDCARYQLIAGATYLPKGHLAKPWFRLCLRYQLVAEATHLRPSASGCADTQHGLKLAVSYEVLYCHPDILRYLTK